MERTHLLLLPIERKITAKGQSSTGVRVSGAPAQLASMCPVSELAALVKREGQEGFSRKFPHFLHESGWYIAIWRAKRTRLGQLLDFSVTQICPAVFPEHV